MRVAREGGGEGEEDRGREDREMERATREDRVEEKRAQKKDTEVTLTHLNNLKKLASKGENATCTKKKIIRNLVSQKHAYNQKKKKFTKLQKLKM
jgi:hypothetical protein